MITGGHDDRVSALASPRFAAFASTLLIVLAIACFREVMVDIWRQWRHNPSFSHGPLTLPIALWLLWLRRSDRPTECSPWALGLLLVLVAHVLLLAGQWLHVAAFGRLALAVWIVGWIGWIGGKSGLRWSAPALGMLVFMIPPPFQVERLVDRLLQFASAEFASCLLALVRIPAATDGFVLWVPAGKVVISEDCSGLGIAISMAALVYVWLCLPSNRRHREDSTQVLSWVLRGASVAVVVAIIAVVSNALRIAVLATAVHRVADREWIEWVHDVGDWAVLPVSAVLLVLGMTWFNRVSPTHDRWVQWIRFPEYAPAVGQVLRGVGFRRLMFPVLAVVALVASGHVAKQRLIDSHVRREWAIAQEHESRDDWQRAAASYERLVNFHPRPVAVRFRHALVMRQIAGTSRELLHDVLRDVQGILRTAPFDPDCLALQLDLALELDVASTAIASFRKLTQADPFDAKNRQRFMETRLRFPQRLGIARWQTTEELSRELESAGEIKTWYPRLIVRFCGECALDGKCVDTETIAALDSVLDIAVKQWDTAEAHYTKWNFRDRYRSNPHPDDRIAIETATERIDATTRSEIEGRIYLARAKDALSTSGRMDEAKIWLDRARCASPNDDRVHRACGEHQAAVGDWRASAASFTRSWQLARRDAAPLDERLDLGYRLVESLLAAGQTALARTVVDELDAQIALGPENSSDRVRHQLGIAKARVLSAEGQHKLALIELRSVRRCDRRTGSLERSRSVSDARKLEDLTLQCLVKLRRYDEAARRFERRAKVRAGDSRDQWIAAARAWRKAGHHSKSAKCYVEAIGSGDAGDEVWLEYLVLLRQHRGHATAVREIREHGSTRTNQTLAQAWEIVGDGDRALPHYEASARAGNVGVAAYAIALAKCGRIAESIKQIGDRSWDVDSGHRARTAAICGVVTHNIDPQDASRIDAIVATAMQDGTCDADTLVSVAEWSARRRNPALAIEQLENALKLDSNHPVAANNLAMLLAEHEVSLERALESIDGVLRRSGAIPAFLDTRGWVLFRLRRFEEAVNCLSDAAHSSLVPDAVTHLHLAAACLGLGNHERAERAYRIAKRFDVDSLTLHPSEQRALEDLRLRFSVVQTSAQTREGA